jgi:hypothetical protein
MKSNFTANTISLSGVTEHELCAVNGNRNYLLIFNAGDKTAFISPNGGVNFISIPPHNGKEWMEVVPLNKFTGKCLTAEATDIVVWEA